MDTGKKPRLLVYLGIALISGSVLISQISFSAILSFLFVQDFRLIEVGLVLLGLGIGGICAIAVAQRDDRVVAFSTAISSFLFAITSVIPFVLMSRVVSLKYAPTSGDQIILAAAIMSHLISFLFAGFILSTLYVREKGKTTGLYIFDLAGAGVGGILWIVLAMRSGFFIAPPAIFLLGGITGLLLLVYYHEKVSKLALLSLLLVTFTAFIGIANIPYSLHCRDDYVKLSGTKSNSFTYTQMFINNETPAFIRFTLFYNCRSSAYGYITNNLENIRGELNGLQNIPFLLSKPEKTLVLGSGAGAEIQRALLAGGTEVTAVEVNPFMMAFANGFPSSYGLSAYQHPNVHSVTEEARLYVTRNTDKYNLIVLGYVVGNIGRPLESKLFAEGYLYTKEAFSLYLERLDKGGMIAITHDGEYVDEFAATLASVLRSRGILPEDHMVIVVGVSKLLLYRDTPFTDADVSEVKVLAEKTGSVAMRYGEDTAHKWRPLTDDQPYLQVTTLDVVRLKTIIGDLTTKNLLRILVTILALSTAALLLSVLYFCTKVVSKRKDIIFPFYAIASSAGLAVLENIFLQKGTFLTGNPVLVYAGVVPFTLLCMGVGSVMFARVTIKSAVRLAVLMSCVMGVYFLFITPVTAALLPLGYTVKLLILATLIIPPALLAGMFFPLGISAAARRNVRYIPWLWGIDTLAFMIWCFVIWIIMFTFGIRASIVLGVIGYLGAAMAIRYFDK